MKQWVLISLLATYTSPNKIRELKMLNKKLLALSITAMLSASAISQTNHFDIEYTDPQDFGVNNSTSFTSPNGVTTVGEYRKELIELATRAVSLQFNFTTKHHLLVDFEAPDGYGAITLGPIFSEILSEGEKDPYDVMQLNRSYPSTLASALTGKPFTSDEDAIISFSNIESSLDSRSDKVYPGLVYDAYHEMMHVMGFVATDCLGNCLPEPVSRDSHISQLFYYNDAGDVKEFESLSMSKKTEAYLSTDKFWFGGTQASRDAAIDELTSGHQNGYVYMYSTPNQDGGVDSQSGSHFSFDVLPAQLMHSSRAATEDLGMAAYLLCDTGWCRGQGKVIEQSVVAEVNENASSDSESVIDITISENLNVGVDEFEFTFMMDPDVDLVSLEDTADACSEIGGGAYRCTGELGFLSTVKLRLVVAPFENYKLTGELRSTGFDVDRNGFNNILDVSFAKQSNDVDNSTDDGSGSTPDPVSIPQPQVQSDSGGGSMSFVMLPLFFIAALGRRFKSK